MPARRSNHHFLRAEMIRSSNSSIDLFLASISSLTKEIPAGLLPFCAMTCPIFSTLESIDQRNPATNLFTSPSFLRLARVPTVVRSTRYFVATFGVSALPEPEVFSVFASVPETTFSLSGPSSFSSLSELPTFPALTRPSMSRAVSLARRTFGGRKDLQ